MLKGSAHGIVTIKLPGKLGIFKSKLIKIYKTLNNFWGKSFKVLIWFYIFFISKKRDFKLLSQSMLFKESVWCI